MKPKCVICGMKMNVVRVNIKCGRCLAAETREMVAATVKELTDGRKA